MYNWEETTGQTRIYWSDPIDHLAWDATGGAGEHGQVEVWAALLSILPLRPQLG